MSMLTNPLVTQIIDIALNEDVGTGDITTETTMTTSTVPSGDVVYGDINLDGAISLLDVIFINKYLANALDLSDVQMKNADCCNDGAVNGADVTALLKHIVRIVEQLPVIPE